MVLCLFFSANVYAETINYNNGDKYVGQTKLLSGKRHGQGTYYYADGRVYVGQWKKNQRHGQGTMTYKNKSKYVGEWKNNKRHGIGTAYYPNGKKIEDKSGVYEDNNFVKKYVEPVKEKKKVKVASSSNSQTSNTTSNDKIAQSKQICRDLGFQVNTEKFADCALKMMTIQFEATNKVASSGGTTQEIIVKHQNDYDIWDALLDVSQALQPTNNSSSYNSGGTRCVIGKTNPMFGTTTMNCN